MMLEYLRTAADLWQVVGTVGVTIGGVIGAIYGLRKFIENTVAERLAHPETIEALARVIRPSVIFNSKQAVLADLGAMAAIEAIVIEHGTPNDPIPTAITIRFKSFIALEPLLTCLDAVTFDLHASREDKFSWRYDLEWTSQMSDVKCPRFRLEILK